MSLAVYPGSFEPLTLGHGDIAARATTLFDVVVIGIAHNAAKAGRHLLDVHERLRLAKEATSHLPGVEVDIVPGLLADYCSRRGASAIIKGHGQLGVQVTAAAQALEDRKSTRLNSQSQR